VGTDVAAGKELRRFGGRDYLLEHAIRADYAFLRAWKADTFGNLVFRRSQRNFNPIMATAARCSIAEIEEKIVPEGAWAANLLGLSTQVPAKIIYLTDGPNNEVLIGRRSIHFKHARPKAMAGLEGKFALVVQALRHIGKQGIGPSEIEKLRSSLSPAEKRRLVKDARFGVDWIYEVAKKIAEKTA